MLRVFGHHAQSKMLNVFNKFTKRLRSMTNLSYTNRLRALGLDTLEHRRLQQDLLHTYKVLFGKLSIDHTDMFCIRLHSITRGHQWKLYPNFHRTNLRKNFFCERVISPWNTSDITNDVQSVSAFKRSAKRSNLSDLALSANLPEGLYILPMFFLYFFYFFLMVDFLANVAETLIEQSSPKFQDW